MAKCPYHSLMAFQELTIPKFEKNPKKSKVARDLLLAGELQIWQISCVWMMYFVFAGPSEGGWTRCTCTPTFLGERIEKIP